jgi:hypothetical protein
VIKLVQKNRNVQLSGQDRLKVIAKTGSPVERAQVARATLRDIM